MNLLGRIFGSKPQAIEDPVFGRMEFAHGVWTRVPREEKDFMVVVVAPETGPVDSQRAFFKKHSASLAEIVESAKRFVQASAGSVEVASLSLYSVEIGPEEEIDRDAFVIELTGAGQSPIHRVEFIGGKPSVYGCDD